MSATYRLRTGATIRVLANGNRVLCHTLPDGARIAVAETPGCSTAVEGRDAEARARHLAENYGLTINQGA